ncbi:hypothetical protein CQW23_21633 [Capsicum baccatum]|uniref:Ubiquitin-like protease family profile domain-containing protein n=1 Tax=Capsicum baccatum TaxID=33114 RepID=A0A2G2VYK4_CAPBA|nr:hypothetical protein CQW23_21633 [Capsicum baccatum]
MVEDGKYEQFSWGKASFQKLIATWRQDFFVEKQLYSIGEIPHVLSVLMYECSSEVDSTISECVSNDFEGFSADVETFTLNAFVEEMVNRKSEDIGTATLNALVDAVVNQNLDYSKVETHMTGNIHKDHSDKYLSTISESAQLEIDAIMQGLAALVDDILLEVVKLVGEIVNLHSLSDCQIPSHYPDPIVATHLAAKTPAKRIRTRSEIFKSPYTTDFASGSKALEDESTDFKQKFAFEGYEISDDMPSSVIEEYKKWDYAESVVVADNENAVNNIIKRFFIPTGLPWHLVDEVYVPINCNQNFHWVLAVIALKNRHWPNLAAYRDNLSDTMPILNINLFEIEYVQNVTQQDCDSLDAEFLLLDMQNT